MTHAFSANLFTWLAGATALFQIALVAGAPWGTLTQGGQLPGALPLPARIIALASAMLLLSFIYLVRGRARSPARFRRVIWIVVAYCAFGIFANAFTPSPAERALWLPIVSLMFLASLHVARRPDRPGMVQ